MTITDCKIAGQGFANVAPKAIAFCCLPYPHPSNQQSMLATAYEFQPMPLKLCASGPPQQRLVVLVRRRTGHTDVALLAAVLAD